MAVNRYLEIADALATELSGQPNGTRAPSEHQVADQFGVGRSAARAALLELERRGLVRRVQGAGTFVQRPLVLTVEQGRSTAWEQLIRMGVGSTTVPSLRSGQLPTAACQAMRLPAGEPGLRANIKISAFDQPVGRSAIWAAGTGMDRSSALGGIREHESVLSMFDARKVHLVYRSAQVALAHSSPELSEELGIAADRPYWKIDAVLVDEAVGLNLWARTEFRADRIALDLRIGAPPRHQRTSR